MNEDTVRDKDRRALAYEIVGMASIVLLDSSLHSTYKLSGHGG
jgi:hypothetical protein